MRNNHRHFSPELETVSLSETLTSTLQSAQRHAPEHHYLPHHHENIKYNIVWELPTMDTINHVSLRIKALTNSTIVFPDHATSINLLQNVYL